MNVAVVIVLAVLAILTFVALLAQGWFHAFTCACGESWRWKRCARCER